MSNNLYQEFIKRYFQEEGITYTKWSEIQPLYLRYRARCLKMRPQSYEQFRNLCLFESPRKTKYTEKGSLKDGCKQGWNQSQITQPLKEEKDYAGAYYTAKRARVSYKLNYKASPKKEDFELWKDFKAAYDDWRYLKDQLADYEAVKAILNRPANNKKPDLIPNEGGDMKRYHYMFEFPWLVRYALKCLGGTFPIECFPDTLTDYKDELKSLLDKQREAFEKEPVNFPLEIGKWIL